MSTFSGQRAARGSRGFTLIEMAITMAIIAILVSIALPAYTSYIARAKRADARTTLLQGAQYMQRFYAANDQYEKDRGGADLVDNMPANLMRSPSDGETVQYTLTVDPSVTAYTLTMTPVAGASMASDPCGSFRITSTGLKSVVGATKSRDECWK